MKESAMGFLGPQPSLGDNLKGMARSVRNGTAMNPLITRKFIKQAQAERLARYPAPSRKGGWYSKYSSEDGTIHVMIGPDGNITTTYPHVHVIHDERGSEVRVVVSRGPGDHPHTFRLPGTASGNEVDAKIAEAIRLL
ncbi:hypothetical protein [Actinomarinicola tropica]|uniref:hypothetical protein n=1 Tax=Actinomarinicola tropica TaxID=2789776 RepID=UPI00189B51C9|nr:hypothetical protein [Actinomarinicola tropica]